MNRAPAASPLGRVLLLLAVAAVLAVATWVGSLAAGRHAVGAAERAGEGSPAARAEGPPSRGGARGRRGDAPWEGRAGAWESARSGGGSEGSDSVPGEREQGAGAVAGDGTGAPGAGVAVGESAPGAGAGASEGEGAGAPGAGGVSGSGAASGGAAGVVPTAPGTSTAAALLAAAAGSASADRYQGRTGPLPADTPRAPSGPAMMRTEGGAPFLASTFPPGKIQAGQDVLIGAYLVDAAGALVAPSAIEVSVARTAEPAAESFVPMLPAEPGAVAQFVYRTVAPADTPAPGEGPLLMHYFLRASGEIDGALYTRGIAGTFSVHSPGARIDAASARVARVGTDVVLAATLHVERIGTFLASAELWGGPDGNRPVAFARERLETPALGDQTLTLLFAGPVIRASNVDGPYRVRNVQLARVDTSPPHEQDPIAELPPTPAWRHTEF